MKLNEINIRPVENGYVIHTEWESRDDYDCKDWVARTPEGVQRIVGPLLTATPTVGQTGGAEKASE